MTGIQKRRKKEKKAKIKKGRGVGSDLTIPDGRCWGKR